MNKPIIDYRFKAGKAENSDKSYAATVTECNAINISTTHDGWGELKKALEFTKSGSHVLIAPDVGITGLAQFAVRMVIRPHTAMARMNLCEGQVVPLALFLKKDASDKMILHASVFAGGGWVETSVPTKPVALNRWTSVGAVLTGDDLVLFINNKLVARRVLRGRDLAQAGTKGVYIGSWVDGQRHGFRGDIAGFQLWNEVPDILLPAIEDAEQKGIGEIESKYQDMGGERGVLGARVGAESAVGGGRTQTYSKGCIYWRRDLGAHEVHGSIYNTYKALRLHASVLGFPQSDEEAGRRGGVRVSRFENGSIYWSSATGARALSGEILVRYLDLEAEAGFLGLPVENEKAVARGMMARFQNGEIYYSNGTGAFEIHGAILASYKRLGGPAGFLGFPLTNESDVLKSDGRPSGGKFSCFTGGTMYWSRTSGAFEVHGAIRTLYESLGGPLGKLGYPITNETNYPGSTVRYNNFQKGIIVWKPGIGARAITDLTLHIGKVRSGTIDDGITWTGKDKNAELITYHTVKSNSRVLANKKRSPSGHAGTSHDINANYHIPKVQHNTKVFMSIRADDWDELSKNDRLGRHDQTFDITNFWGLLGGSPAGIYSNRPATHKEGGSLPSLGKLKFDYSIANKFVYDPNIGFLGQCWWRSNNFCTDTLTRQQYADTFRDVDNAPSTWDKIVNPFDTLYYETAYKGISKDGNCVGMSLEGVYARKTSSIFAEPIYQHKMNRADDQDNTEANILAGVRTIINEKHAYQIGASCIRWVIGRLTDSTVVRPMLVFERVEALLRMGDYPIISMMDLTDFSGHAVMPYECERRSGTAADPHRIYVADPNAPWRTSAANRNADHMTWINVTTNNTFSTHNMPSVYQSGTMARGMLPSTLMFDIPFHVLCHQPRTPFWEVLMALAFLTGGILILAGDASSEQLSSGSQKFYSGTGRNRKVVANGIPGMARMPHLFSPGPRVVPGGVTAGVRAGALAGLATAVLGRKDLPELYFKRGMFPEALQMDLIGNKKGRYDQLMATRHGLIHVDSPVASGARDTLRLERANTPRSLLDIKTSEAQKKANIVISNMLDGRGKDQRQYEFALPLAKGDAAHAGMALRGESLIVKAGGKSQKIDIKINNVINGRKAAATVSLTPAAGEVLRIRPKDFSSLRGEMVVESLSSLDGGVLKRNLVRPR